ncbi:MAG: WD40 repeat domain-containing protein, partial [Bacteroidota bacterium]
MNGPFPVFQFFHIHAQVLKIKTQVGPKDDHPSIVDIDRVFFAGKPLSTYQVHTDMVTAASFSPDGKAVITGSLDKTARLYDLAG